MHQRLAQLALAALILPFAGCDASEDEGDDHGHEDVEDQVSHAAASST